ncbi:protein trichome birefringence-like 8 [Sesamum angolense]|uniref:Protein trichome birefringence-like 8 n=1 Tax=Sesamum angolense TaxID=2727404 RepID=A0AAE2BWR6_9LAMI|nr:protein trichome birefringence-like 8 [Sesamum angolense]
MESGYGMKPYLIGDTLRSARFWIQDFDAVRVADMICATKMEMAAPSLFDANDFLERGKNGRIVFAGDSICRNQWESLICMLAQGVSNQSTIYEEHGNPITKHKGFLSIKFQEYNLKGWGGEWNKGGTCNTSREPETDYSKLELEPPNNIMIYEATEQMKSAMRTVKFLNITYLTEFRSDGYPSRNREPGTPVDAPEDCSHWCLPGVPDVWNELLYAELLRMEFRTRMT